jgi:ABC-type uncharacterized transport system auxiliary subunit
MKRSALLLMLAGALAGCIRFHVPAPVVHDYVLDYPPPHVEGRALPVILRIAPLAVAAIYDRQPIVYRDGIYSTGTYFDRRWSANPGSMVADVLARDFNDSGLYRAVQRAPSLLAGDYQVGGEIEAIEEEAGAGGCAAHLRLRMLVMRLRLGKGDPVLLQRTYTGDEPCPCNQPGALVAAMSHGLEKISAQLQRDVYEAIAADVAGTRHPLP